jgi:RNA polymerase sigma-B factor
MTISALDEAPSRAVRREETARLLSEASTLKGKRREQVIDQVIVLNIGVAHAIAHRYRNRSVPVEDLEQVACMALVRAAQKFDVDQNRDFLTYAVPTISGEIKRHFRDQGWTIRPPRRVQEIQSKVIHAYHHGEEHGAPPSAARIAEQLDLPVADVSEALQAEGCFRPVSLDVPVTEDGRPAIDQLTEEESGDERALEARLMLGPAVRHLSDRDRKILYLRFVEDRTQQEIGNELGVTQMQASRLLKRILDQLRGELGADAVPA